MVLQVAGSSFNPWLLPGEREALLWITGHQSPWLDLLLLPISLAGEWGACWILLVLGLYIWGGEEQRRLGLRLGLTMFLASVLVVLPLRGLLPRHRPYQVFPQVRQKGLPLEGRSFPSGHAQAACLAAVYLGARRRRFALPLALFAVLMCYSRVYCGMHYPLDVLGGGMIGVLSGGSLLLLERRKRVETPTA